MEAEDFERFDPNYRGTSPRSNNKSRKHMRRRLMSEDGNLDFDTDEELPAHPNWKSSHVADSRHRGRGPTGPSRRLSFGSDEEFGPPSDLDDDEVDDFKTRSAKGNKPISSRNHRRRGDLEDIDYSDSDFDDSRSNIQRNRFGPKKMEAMRRGNNSSGGERYKFVNDSNRSFRGSWGDNKRSKWDDYDGRKMNDRRSNSKNNRGFEREGFRNNSGLKREGFGKSRRGVSDKYDRDGSFDPNEFRNSRRVIER